MTRWVWDDLDVDPPTQGMWTAAFLILGIVALFIAVAFVTGPVKP